MRLWLHRRPSPIGDMLLAWDAEARLRVLDFSDYEDRMQTLLRLHYGDCELKESALPPAIADALTRYFDGDIAAIDAILVMSGGTDFQRAVWAELRNIPAGETISYGELAHRLGRPKAVRAVGGANGANPIGIVVPCHRVIGANGTLTGYGGGMHRKKWLLAHEAGRSEGDLFARPHGEP
jgi:methylated-DNA-[protein]-cysteine S-methyltransferase